MISNGGAQASETGEAAILKTAPAELQRLFLAIEVPEAVKQELENVQADCRRRLADSSVTWTRAENLHLTLRFFGNLETGRTTELLTCLHRGCQIFGPLSLSCRRIGFFPPRKRPRVLWAGVEDEANCLPEFVRSINVATSRFGEDEPERRFNAHITIGRIKEITRRDVEALTELVRKLAEAKFGSWPAKEILLMRSELRSEGARHSILERVVLPGSQG